MNNLDKINDYLYKLRINSVDYNYASNYFDSRYRYFPDKITYPPPRNPGCTSVRKGNYYGRNFDWYYNDNVSIVIKTPHTRNTYESIGIANSHNFTKYNIENNLLTDEDFKLLPFYTLDGINEHGLICNLNVTSIGDHGITRGAGRGNRNLCISMLPRWILDHCKSVQDAISKIRNELTLYGMYNQDGSFMEEFHLMLADSIDTYIIEFNCNSNEDESSASTHIVFYNAKENNREFMTNFNVNVANVINNQVDYTTVDPYGAGIERYNLILDKYDELSSSDDMMSLMKDDLKYTNTYTLNEWPTEIAGANSEMTVQLAFEDTDQFKSYLEYSIAMDRYTERSRDTHLSWFTSHTSVYDMSNLSLNLYIQEGEISDTIYQFRLKDNNMIATYTDEAEEYLDSETTIKLKSLYISTNEISSVPSSLSDFTKLTKVSGSEGGTFNGEFVNGESDFTIKGYVVTFDYNDSEKVLAYSSDSIGFTIHPNETKVVGFYPTEEYRKLIKYDTPVEPTPGGGHPEATDAQADYANPSSEYLVMTPAQVKAMIEQALAGHTGGDSIPEFLSVPSSTYYGA